MSTGGLFHLYHCTTMLYFCQASIKWNDTNPPAHTDTHAGPSNIAQSQFVRTAYRTKKTAMERQRLGEAYRVYAACAHTNPSRCTEWMENAKNNTEIDVKRLARTAVRRQCVRRWVRRRQQICLPAPNNVVAYQFEESNISLLFGFFVAIISKLLFILLEFLVRKTTGIRPQFDMLYFAQVRFWKNLNFYHISVSIFWNRISNRNKSSQEHFISSVFLRTDTKNFDLLLLGCSVELSTCSGSLPRKFLYRINLSYKSSTISIFGPDKNVNRNGMLTLDVCPQQVSH